VCGDFAETLHNKAEAAGIRTAFVHIELDDEDTGHALNAFHTTDKGLVFIDCTGKGFSVFEIPPLPSYPNTITIIMGETDASHKKSATN